MKKLKVFTREKAIKTVYDFVNNDLGLANLSGYTSIDDDAAEVLTSVQELNSRNFNRRLNIYAPDINTLSEKSAEFFSMHDGDLNFNSLDSLTPRSLSLLAGSSCNQLHFGGLSELADCDISKLGLFRGEVLSLEIKSISIGLARALSQRVGALYLDELESLPDDAAMEFSSFIPNCWLSLGGLSEISDLSVEALAKRGGWLNLSGLKSISKDGVESLARIESLQVDRKIKNLISKYRMVLSREGKQNANIMVKNKSVASANMTALIPQKKDQKVKNLSPLKQLILLEDITDDHVELINKVMQKQDFCFTHNNIRSMTISAAREFANHDCILVLTLSDLSESVARELSNNRLVLDLKGFDSLTAEAARALSMHKGSQLYLSSLTTLPDSVAQELAAYCGQLDLTGVTSLSDVAATALATHKGELNLSGVTSLSQNAITVLSSHKGKVDLSGLS